MHCTRSGKRVDTSLPTVIAAITAGNNYDCTQQIIKVSTFLNCKFLYAQVGVLYFVAPLRDLSCRVISQLRSPTTLQILGTKPFL